LNDGGGVAYILLNYLVSCDTRKTAVIKIVFIHMRCNGLPLTSKITCDRDAGRGGIAPLAL
jgi:hypothetical protein